MKKKARVVTSICILCIIGILFGLSSVCGVDYTEISEDEVPLGSTPYDDSFLLDMADYDLWESGEYNQADGEKSYNRRRMRTPDPIIRNYVEYHIELSENINLIFCEYDEQMNYLGCCTLSDGDTFVLSEDAFFFTVTIYRTYSEKSLSPGQWNKLFTTGLTVRIIHGDERLFEEAGSADAGDVFLMDMGYFILWESGDYSQQDGSSIENKRRLRYPDYIDRMHDTYLVELSESLNINIFEFDGSMNYLGCTTYENGDYFVPKADTAQFTASVYRNYSEKSMSYGQWNAFFGNDLTIRISHGDVSVFELEKDKVLCTDSGYFTPAGELADALLNNDSRTLADGLWNNLILNDIYSLTGHDLDNGNLTIYISSSEGCDDNHGLSPQYPKASLDAYSGMSNINILLKCGDTFKMNNSFVVGSNCVYAAYGEGERPVLDYYRELNLIFEEVDGCNNVWAADISGLSICNNARSKSNCNMGQLLIDGKVNWKRRVGSTDDTFDPASLSATADGGWAADWNTNLLYVYSEENPNYCNISYAPPLHAITMNKVSNVEFKGIEIMGAGMHGISIKDAENIDISSCYIHHIGGSILVSAGVRYGNAIQLWDSGTNISASHNFADWIFDTCYTNQGTGSSSMESNVVFSKNIGAHSFWGIETWGDGYSENPFSGIEYDHNILYSMMDVTNPDTAMYSSKSGKIIFAEPDMTKEQYVSYRCGYTYHQMSSVNVSNSGIGEPTKIHNNIFWNTNRFLAIIANDRKEELFSCLYDNLFFGQTDVAGSALFRYTEGGGTKNYLESPDGYIDASNRISIWPGGESGDNFAELEELITLMEIISGTSD